MKKWRMVVCVLLTVALLALCIPQLPRATAAAVASGICGNNLRWTLDSEGTLTVSGTGEMYDYNLDAPWYEYRESIKKVEMQSGVTTVGVSAFMECSALKTVELPATLKEIHASAFAFCGMTEVELPANLVSLGSEAFAHCTQLATIEVPDSLRQLGVAAFAAPAWEHTMPFGPVYIG